MLFDLLFVEYNDTGFLEEAMRLFEREALFEGDGDRFPDRLRLRHVSLHAGDIALVSKRDRVFLSPGNSLGFMDGGVDYALSRLMFPGCQSALRARIAMMGMETALGRPYLRVGCAASLSFPEDGAYLIAAPTMFLPHNVSATNNAFHAFYAALGALSGLLTREVSRDRVVTLVCPALCCGYGKMNPFESARQIYAAYKAFSSSPVDVIKRSALDAADDRTRACAATFGYSVFLTASRDGEQPDNFDNREIKDTYDVHRAGF